MRLVRYVGLNTTDGAMSTTQTEAKDRLEYAVAVAVVEEGETSVAVAAAVSDHVPAEHEDCSAHCTER